MSDSKPIVVVDLEQPPSPEDYCGFSFIAIGLKIKADSPAEANARLAKFLPSIIDAVEASPNVVLTDSGRETVFACELTAHQHRGLERHLRARQARDQ
jgi:hypothetical protein